MKLISTTDFVLKQQKAESNVNDSFKKTLSNIYNYAEFLRKPLKIEMFAQIDSQGRVIESIAAEEWEDSKRKVIFKGFKFVKQLNDDNGFKSYRLLKDGDIFYLSLRFYKTIEDLIIRDIELVDSFIK